MRNKLCQRRAVRRRGASEGSLRASAWRVPISAPAQDPGETQDRLEGGRQRTAGYVLRRGRSPTWMPCFGMQGVEGTERSSGYVTQLEAPCAFSRT